MTQVLIHALLVVSGVAVVVVGDRADGACRG